MRSPWVVFGLISLVMATLILLLIGPRQVGPDIFAAFAIGTLLGGLLDRCVLPILVRTANRLMRRSATDDR